MEKRQVTLKRGALEGFDRITRDAAAQGAVLLKNEHGVLPLKEGCRVALFGRMQFDYVKSGTGSGGMVNVTHVINIYDALRKETGVHLDETLADVYRAWLEDHPFDDGKGAWAAEPWSQVEMPVTAEIAQAAACRNDVAIVVIARSAGEDHDNAAEPGSYFLSEDEREMLRTVRTCFSRVVVLLNAGSLMDLSWEEDTDALLCLWQGGMEGGAAAADLITGRVTPSGKLSATAALEIADYPSDAFFGDPEGNDYAEDIYVGYRFFETFAKERVRYPFGFGLSYTSFDVAVQESVVREEEIILSVNVKNVGGCPGREVVQAYFGAPQGKLGRPARELCAYEKTRLLAPQEEETLTLSFPIAQMAAYDDSGVTGAPSCYVLEAGDYAIYVGTDCRSARLCLTHTLATQRIVKRLAPRMTAAKPFKRMHPQVDEHNALRIAWEDAPVRPREDDMAQIARPESIPVTGDVGLRLMDVKQGRATLEQFIAQFDAKTLLPICFGEGMNSPKVTPGTGGALAGVTPELLRYGIPTVCCSDGPSGIRMDDGQSATGMPNGTLLACTWDRTLQEELFTWEGLELAGNRVDILLGPGMNIQRHPLCGRNFEYFSEDPYLCGTIAAAQQRGLLRAGAMGTIKHFACNNQEKKRFYADARVSERALREIYLRGFEIAVKDGSTRCIMTSYNPINGVWSASNREMVLGILRGEWGYDGIVMTDWWALANEGAYQEPDRAHTGAMIRASNDLYMVTDDAQVAAEHTDAAAQLEAGKLTMGEIQQCAMDICRVALETGALMRLEKEPYETAEYVITFSEEGRAPHVTDPALLDPDAQVIEVDGQAHFGAMEVRPACMQGKLVRDKHSGALCVNSRNSFIIYRINVHQAGRYRVTLGFRSEQAPQAQMSCQFILDDEPRAMLSLNGTQGKWITVYEEMEWEQGVHDLKLRFPRSGYEISDISIKRV